VKRGLGGKDPQGDLAWDIQGFDPAIGYAAAQGDTLLGIQLHSVQKG